MCWLPLLQRSLSHFITKYTLPLLFPAGNTALVHAATMGYLPIAEALVNNGCDLNKGPGQETPLYIATREGFLEIVELLIKAGADVNKGPPAGSPLQIAQQRRYTKIVNLLIAAGAKEKKDGCECVVL